MLFKINYLIYTILAIQFAFISCNKSNEPNPSDILITSIAINGSNITDGKTSQLTATVLPENAANKEITWSVSNEDIATIDQNGLLTAVSNGNVIVTAAATDGSGVTGSKLMVVSGITDPTFLVESITIQGANITDGKSKQLSADVLPVNATNKAITWSVSNENIATIDAEGLLTPIQNGTVTVTATAQDASGVKGELEVSVSGIDGIVVNSATQIMNAINNAEAGDIIYVRAGNYEFTNTISISKSGQNGNLITLVAHPNDSERPVFDFSAMSENSSNRGINLSASYWHIKGIDVYNAGDNGMFISGSNNLIEFCSFYENSDTGLQLGNGASNNTILNCDSYYNADSSLENADGFAAKLDVGSGNKFIGCRAWNNLDDGWDGYLRGADNVKTYYENCWSFRNGYLQSGAVSGGDGNGFKTGGSDGKDLKHNGEYRNCIAAGNLVDGFDHNSNRGDILIYNGSAHDNGRNFSFGTGNIAASLTVKNSVSFESHNTDQLNATTTDITNNSWQDGLSATSQDFVSVDIDELLSPRKEDGSLPDINYLHLVSESDLIDKGIDVGLPFSGSAPDLGAFEFE